MQPHWYFSVLISHGVWSIKQQIFWFKIQGWAGHCNLANVMWCLFVGLNSNRWWVGQWITELTQEKGIVWSRISRYGLITYKTLIVKPYCERGLHLISSIYNGPICTCQSYIMEISFCSHTNHQKDFLLQIIENVLTDSKLSFARMYWSDDQE